MGCWLAATSGPKLMSKTTIRSAPSVPPLDCQPLAVVHIAYLIQAIKYKQKQRTVNSGPNKSIKARL